MHCTLFTQYIIAALVVGEKTMVEGTIWAFGNRVVPARLMVQGSVVAARLHVPKAPVGASVRGG
jgi:hypothetical protein